MSDIIVCIKFLGMAHDEAGNPAYAGMQFNFGAFAEGKELPYEELIKQINKAELIKLTGMEDLIDVNSVEFITPEEYDRDYNDDIDDDLGEQRCRVCGCTNNHACPGGCYWVEDDLCSACAGNEENNG